MKKKKVKKRNRRGGKKKGGLCVFVPTLRRSKSDMAKRELNSRLENSSARFSSPLSLEAPLSAPRLPEEAEEGIAAAADCEIDGGTAAAAVATADDDDADEVDPPPLPLPPVAALDILALPPTPLELPLAEPGGAAAPSL